MAVKNVVLKDEEQNTIYPKTKVGNLLDNSENAVEAVLTTTNQTITGAKQFSGQALKVKNASNAAGVATLQNNAEAATTLTLPATTGTIALTSQIPASVVNTIGGQNGTITLGNNLSMSGKQLTVASMVNTIGGKSGAITLGAGLSIDSNNVMTGQSVQLYQHNLTINSFSDVYTGAEATLTIINDKITPLTFTTLCDYLEENGLNDPYKYTTGETGSILNKNKKVYACGGVFRLFTGGTSYKSATLMGIAYTTDDKLMVMGYASGEGNGYAEYGNCEIPNTAIFTDTVITLK